VINNFLTTYIISSLIKDCQAKTFDIYMLHKLQFKTIIYLGGIFLLLGLIFVLAQMVLAKNGNGGFQIKDSYIEVQKTDYPN